MEPSKPDWQSGLAQRQQLYGWSVLIIPTGTLVYKGIRIGKPPSISTGFYLADALIATKYAFDARYKEIGDSDQSKVLEYVVMEPLVLLDMEVLSNYHRLSAGFEVPPSGVRDNESLLEYVFGYHSGRTTLERYSHASLDEDFARWFCSLDLFDGYAYINLPGFHSEIMVCPDKVTKIGSTGIEYRYVPKYNEDVIVKTDDGYDTGIEFSMTKLRIRPRITMHRYKPNPADPTDAFLFDPKFGYETLGFGLIADDS